MKATMIIKRGFLIMVIVAFIGCGSGSYHHKGTASDRTGTNGATNGNGKTPSTSAHKVNY